MTPEEQNLILGLNKKFTEMLLQAHSMPVEEGVFYLQAIKEIQDFLTEQRKMMIARKPNENEIFEAFKAFMNRNNPGVACGLSIRNFAEAWVSYKIEMLPMLNGYKDKMRDEFDSLIDKNFKDKE